MAWPRVQQSRSRAVRPWLFGPSGPGFRQDYQTLKLNASTDPPFRVVFRCPLVFLDASCCDLPGNSLGIPPGIKNTLFLIAWGIPMLFLSSSSSSMITEIRLTCNHISRPPNAHSPSTVFTSLAQQQCQMKPRPNPDQPELSTSLRSSRTQPTLPHLNCPSSARPFKISMLGKHRFHCQTMRAIIPMRYRHLILGRVHPVQHHLIRTSGTSVASPTMTVLQDEMRTQSVVCVFYLCVMLPTSFHHCYSPKKVCYSVIVTVYGDQWPGV